MKENMRYDGLEVRPGSFLKKAEQKNKAASLTEKQENYKKILFKEIENEIEYCNRKLNQNIVKKLGKEQVYQETIQECEKLLETEWTKENFSELVDTVKSHSYAKYAR